jgi:putative ATPase
LLTWEILRRAPEGGTWALAWDRQVGEGLRQQAERLPELERPVVLIGDPSSSSERGLGELGELLRLRGEGDLRFDAIVGRNALGPIPNKVEALWLLARWLRPGGLLSLAETVVKYAQRLHKLVDVSCLEDDLRQRVIEGEEQIYSAPDDALVDWDAADLQRALEAAGFEEVAIQEEVQEAEMLVSPATLDRWFAVDARRADLDRPSYAQHLLRRITAGELAEVRALFQRQLAGQAVAWQTRVAFIVGRI